MTDQTREKPTKIDTVLAPVAELAAGKPTKHRFIDLDGQEQILDYQKVAQQDPYPIPMPVDREGYGTVDHSAQHWATGHGDWLNVKDAIARYLQYEPKRLLDFGCATGRFLRHALIFGELETHGCDFAPANVEWASRYLPPETNVVLNTAEPKLDYPDNHFDIVTAFSVFTHIDRDESVWLAELKRITTQNGLLYITIQNDAAWSKVLDRPGMFEHLSQANSIEGNLKVSRDTFHEQDARSPSRFPKIGCPDLQLQRLAHYTIRRTNMVRLFQDFENR